jgi:hypothetical protein
VIAEKLFDEPQNAIGKIVKTDKQSFRVVGVLEKKGGGGFGGPDFDSFIYLPYKTGYIFNPDKKFLSVILVADPSVSTDAAKKEISQTLLRRYKADDFSIVELAEIQKAVTGLEFGTRYQATVFATNEAGDETAGKPFVFITVRDVIPPQISKVTNESTLYPSEDTKVQTIITWQTDEPANCTVSYTQGLVHDENNQGDSLPTETNPLTDHTQVIVGFAPATVYKFWVICADPSGNESKSDDFVLITPIKEKNIIDIILENFQGTFGWVNKIGK